MTIFALTPLLLSFLLLRRRPWKAPGLARRSGGLFATGAAILLFLFAGVSGTTEFLRQQFGLFVGIEDYGPRAIAVSPSAYVVVGDNSDSDGIVWRSSDGRNWARIEHSDVFDRLDVGDVAWVDTEFVVVAHDDRRGPIVALVSPDGLTWRRTASSEIDGKPYSLASNDDKLAIVGSSFSNDGVFVFGSPSGPLLMADPEPSIDRNREPFFVTSHGTGFLSIGNQKSDSVIMSSDDGASWAETDRLTGIELVSATAYELGYAAIGRERRTGAPVMYRSVNGDKWSPTDAPVNDPAIRLDLVTSFDEQLFVLGHEVSNNRIRLWQSAGGELWHELVSPFGDAVIRDALISEEIAIVVGVDRKLDVVAIWISNDNLNWERIADSAIFSVH